MVGQEMHNDRKVSAFEKSSNSIFRVSEKRTRSKKIEGF